MPNTPKSSTRPIRFGTCDYTFPSDELAPLSDSSDLVGDRDALRDRLDQDGYLYLPGFLDRDEVLAARLEVLNFMAEHEGIEPGSRPLDGVMGEYGKSVHMLGQKPITHRDNVLRVLASPKLFEFYQFIHGASAITFDFKWLRAVGNEECTGAHMDHVYMGRGSNRLMTAWVPLDDLPMEMGTLCVCPGSHRLPEFEKLRNTYGKMDVDRDRVDGWFTKNPREITEHFGSCWHTSDVRAGDIITFGMHLMHASTTNVTDKWRLSCDVRFQPEADPVDERWVGEDPKGHYRWYTEPEKIVPMEDARKQWGV